MCIAPYLYLSHSLSVICIQFDLILCIHTLLYLSILQHPVYRLRHTNTEHAQQTNKHTHKYINKHTPTVTRARKHYTPTRAIFSYRSLKSTTVFVLSHLILKCTQIASHFFLNLHTNPYNSIRAACATQALKPHTQMCTNRNNKPGLRIMYSIEINCIIFALNKWRPQTFPERTVSC